MISSMETSIEMIIVVFDDKPIVQSTVHYIGSRDAMKSLSPTV